MVSPVSSANFAAHVDVRRNHAAQAAEDLVAVGVRRGLLGRDLARVDHLLHARVVLGGGQERPPRKTYRRESPACAQ